MSKLNGRFVRSYALDVLVELNDQPHINKEKLFADAMAYYRWQFTHSNALESLPLYQREFNAQHSKLLSPRPPAVRAACFITWFVENIFHKMPPLVTPYPDDECFQRTRFSSPSFYLPTGEASETFLVQWIYWLIDHPPVSPDAPCDEQHLALALVNQVHSRHALDLDAWTELNAHSARFFRWCWHFLRSWDVMIVLLILFYNSEEGRVVPDGDFLCADAALVNWFCHRELDQPARAEAILEMARDREKHRKDG